MAGGPRLWTSMAAAGAGRLGALPSRTLGLDRSLGLDLDRRRCLGLCAVSLWALGLRQFCVVLGPRKSESASGLCASAGRVAWGPEPCLGSPRFQGGISAELPRERRLRSTSQCQYDTRRIAEHGSAFGESSDSRRNIGGIPGRVLLGPTDWPEPRASRCT